MSLVSGKDGTLCLDDTEVTPVVNWRIEKRCAGKAYVANDTGGAKKRVAGAKDCSGRFEIKATTSGSVPVEEGDAVTLKLHIDGSGDNYYHVPAVIDTIRVAVRIDTGSVPGYRITFHGNGPVTAHGILEKSSGGP